MEAPPNTREVPKDEFFAALRADSRDIMPVIVTDEYPYTSEWRSRDTRRELFGVSRDNQWWLA